MSSTTLNLKQHVQHPPEDRLLTKILSTETLIRNAEGWREGRSSVQFVTDFLFGPNSPHRENLDTAKRYLAKAQDYLEQKEFDHARQWERLAYEAIGEEFRNYSDYQLESLNHGTNVAEGVMYTGGSLFLVGVTGGLGAWALGLGAVEVGAGATPLMALASKGAGGAALAFGAMMGWAGSGYSLASVGKRFINSFVGGEEAPLDSALMKKDFRDGAFAGSLQFFFPFASATGQAWAENLQGFSKTLVQLLPFSFLQAGHGAAQVVSEGGTAAQAAQATVLGAVLPFAFHGMIREFALSTKPIPQTPPPVKKLPFEYVDLSEAPADKIISSELTDTLWVGGGSGRPGPWGYSASGLVTAENISAEPIVYPTIKTNLSLNSEPTPRQPMTDGSSGKPMGFGKIQAPSGMPAMESQLPGESRPPMQVPAIPGVISIELASKKQEPIGDPITGPRFMGDEDSHKKKESLLNDLSHGELRKLRKGEKVVKSISETNGTVLDTIFLPQKNDRGEVIDIMITYKMRPGDLQNDKSQTLLNLYADKAAENTPKEIYGLLNGKSALLIHAFPTGDPDRRTYQIKLDLHQPQRIRLEGPEDSEGQTISHLEFIPHRPHEFRDGDKVYLFDKLISGGSGGEDPYRHSAAQFDPVVRETAKSNVRLALEKGGFKASPVFGSKYMEVIVDLNSGAVLNRKSVPLPPRAKKAASQGESHRNLSWWDLLLPFSIFFLQRVEANSVMARLHQDIEKNMALNPIEGPGWTSLTFTLHDLFQGKINLPDWEVSRLKKMLKQKDLSPGQRGVIQGLIDLDEVY